MPLPSSGTITKSQVGAEVGVGNNSAYTNFNWIRANTKDAMNRMNGLYGRAWYQKNNGGVNDTRAWLQANCNCDCNCNCACSD